MNKNCACVKKDGSNCQAYQIQDSQYCFRHDPINKEKSLQASRKGGENRRLQETFGKPVILNSAEDVKTFLGLVINSVWTGNAPVTLGTSMGFLTRCWLDAYEKSEIEKKLNNLEQRLQKAKL
jgi:hypothetical protein